MTLHHDAERMALRNRCDRAERRGDEGQTFDWRRS
jgi:hypothetical protein